MTSANTLSRRQLICGSGALLAWHVRPSWADAATLGTREIAPGVHFRRGVDEDASTANDDAIANIGFIVGTQCVAVIDPGGSLRDGER